MAIAAATPIKLQQKSQQITIDFIKSAYASLSQHIDMRERMLAIDRLYMREKDRTAEQSSARTANAYGDADKLQNITVPVVLPVVESAVTYHTSVFLTGSPLFGVASNRENMDAAMQLETIIDNCTFEGNSSNIRGGGINVQSAGFTKMTKLKIFNNLAEGKAGSAIYQNSATNSLINSVVYNNTGCSIYRILQPRRIR